jgi:arabinofuranan 3-O-arabinosyltransferase
MAMTSDHVYSARPATLTTSAASSSAVAKILWPLAILSFTYQVVRATGQPATDFTPVWDAARAFLHHQDPFANEWFVYPPSSLLLLAPVGITGLAQAKVGFALIDSLAVLIAVGLTLRLFRIPVKSVAAAATLLGVSLAMPLASTLAAGNVNGLIVAGEVGALLAASRQRWGLSGMLLGSTLAIKPILLPLVLLFVVCRQWRGLVVALAIPAGLSAVALTASVNRGAFFTDVLPFLVKGQLPNAPAFNVSIDAFAKALGIGTSVGAALRLAAIVLVGSLFVVRLRSMPRSRWSDPLVLTEWSSLILVGCFLSFSITWPHYSIYLLPLFVSVVRPDSVMRSWIAWVGAYFMLSPDVWASSRLPDIGNDLAHFRPMFGYLLLVAAFAISTRRRETQVANQVERSSTKQRALLPRWPAAAPDPGP